MDAGAGPGFSLQSVSAILGGMMIKSCATSSILQHKQSHCSFNRTLAIDKSK